MRCTSQDKGRRGLTGAVRSVMRKISSLQVESTLTSSSEDIPSSTKRFNSPTFLGNVRSPIRRVVFRRMVWMDMLAARRSQVLLL